MPLIMNNNTPLTLPSNIQRIQIFKVLKKLTKAFLICLPLIFLTTVAYSMNAADVITSHSMTDVLDSPNKAIIGFGFMEQKIHVIVLLFMAFLMFMGHKDQILQKA